MHLLGKKNFADENGLAFVEPGYVQSVQYAADEAFDVEIVVASDGRRNGCADGDAYFDSTKTKLANQLTKMFNIQKL